MPNPTAVPLFNSQIPAPDLGYKNVQWQTDAGVPVQKITAELPNYGNVNVLPFQFYPIVVDDCGKMIVYNNTTPGQTGDLHLPHPPPFPNWTCSVTNDSGINQCEVIPLSGDTLDGSVLGITLPVGAGAFIYTDGTSYFSLRSGSDAPYHVVSFLPGLLTAHFQVLQWTCPSDSYIWRGVQFYSNFAGSSGYCQAAPTSGATYIIGKLVAGSSPGTTPTNIGSIAINTSGGFSFASAGGAAFNFQPGDTLTVFSPVSADPTLASVGFTLAGFR